MTEQEYRVRRFLQSRIAYHLDLAERWGRLLTLLSAAAETKADPAQTVDQ